MNGAPIFRSGPEGRAGLHKASPAANGFVPEHASGIPAGCFQLPCIYVCPPKPLAKGEW